MNDGIRITNEQISDVLQTEVLKRETIDGDKATDARRTVVRAHKKQAASKKVADADIVVPQSTFIEASREPQVD